MALPPPPPPSPPRSPGDRRPRRDAPPCPSKDEIATMAPFERLGLDRIHVSASLADAERALELLRGGNVLGFDTESKPTFTRGEVSDGPHVVQLATREHAVIFLLHDRHSRDAAATVLCDAAIVKAGFGLGDDRKRIVSKMAIDPQGIIDLNADFRRLGHRHEMGVRGAVALLFGRRFLKSGKAATSNWSKTQLDESQILYAANDAWAALRVYEALAARGELAPGPGTAVRAR